MIFQKPQPSPVNKGGGSRYDSDLLHSVLCCRNNNNSIFLFSFYGNCGKSIDRFLYNENIDIKSVKPEVAERIAVYIHVDLKLKFC